MLDAYTKHEAVKVHNISGLVSAMIYIGYVCFIANKSDFNYFLHDTSSLRPFQQLSLPLLTTTL